MSQFKFILFFFILLIYTSCSDDEILNNTPEDTMELLASYKIGVLEPSGLTIDKFGTTLYTVSDNTGCIYKLSTEGDILKTYDAIGIDLEGVSIYKDNKLVITDERTKQIIEYDLSTGIISKHYINYKNSDDNTGIEGIAFKENDGTFFILNEKNPGKLFRLRADYSIIIEYDLNFATDYSGIFYDDSMNNLWIISDQSKTINRCTLQGALIEKYPINITQAEGVAITNDKIYIVSDIEAKLYVYKKP